MYSRTGVEVFHGNKLSESRKRNQRSTTFAFSNQKQKHRLKQTTIRQMTPYKILIILEELECLYDALNSVIPLSHKSETTVARQVVTVVQIIMTDLPYLSKAMTAIRKKVDNTEHMKSSKSSEPTHTLTINTTR